MKLTSLKFIFFSVFCAISGFLNHASAQDTSGWLNVSDLSEWKLVLSSNQVKVYSKVQSCDDANGFPANKLMFRVENQTKKYIAVDWDCRMYYNQRLTNEKGNSPEYHKRIALRPNQNFETTCDNQFRDITIYVSLVGREAAEEMKQIEFLNLKIYE
ncbi:MAG: hypothetical protein ACK574_08610 [Bacteroidota bacterium]